MSAFLSLVLASALTASYGIPVADSYSATTSVSQDLLSSTGSVSSFPHPTYYVRSDLHDSWEKENARREGTDNRAVQRTLEVASALSGGICR